MAEPHIEEVRKVRIWNIVEVRWIGRNNLVEAELLGRSIKLHSESPASVRQIEQGVRQVLQLANEIACRLGEGVSLYKIPRHG